MSCTCNAHENQRQPGPLDQCLLCALKHWDAAFNAYNEFRYERRNRNWVRSNVKAIISHTYRQWPAIADIARDLWHVIAERRDGQASAADKLEALGDAIQNELEKEI